MSFQTSVTCLKISSILLIVLGALFSWTTVGPWAQYNLLFVDFIIGPFDGGQSYSATETRLLAAITGGITTGLGVLFWMITHFVYASDPVLGRRMILAGICSWFVVDSVGSMLAGAPFNVIANAGLLLMFVLPVVLVSAEDRAQTV